MTLKGNLKDFSFIQLLNLINLANKSGTLYVDRLGEKCRAVFLDGKLAYFANGDENSNLLKILADHKLISAGQKTLLTLRFRELNDKEAGIYLVNAGYTSLEQVLRVLEEVYSKHFRRLFAWEEAFFRFETGELPPPDRIPVHMGLENIILEGARQLREIEELRAEIPSLEMALKFTDHPGTDIRNTNLTSAEWRVVSYVNPKNTIQQIAATVNMDDSEVRRVVYTLLQAGLVEMVRPGGQPVALPGKPLPVKNPPENRSLIQRLIDRIRAI